ncbi:hypothetical protein L211DRAFT_854223 [Terfezia boudieri ATCC MYA-4762]|uniref:Uncharacterized protein n=1 Tax=Terfezia boudieri ATCC MYA-4762 TaxID=1051890 RepID=A0A3N4LK74_9PEZI|nr:hypothetical protein L211DRAFT_854223 [Terfezia boudieri ATCC MYA-4762]
MLPGWPICIARPFPPLVHKLASSLFSNYWYSKDTEAAQANPDKQPTHTAVTQQIPRHRMCQPSYETCSRCNKPCWSLVVPCGKMCSPSELQPVTDRVSPQVTTMHSAPEAGLVTLGAADDDSSQSPYSRLVTHKRTPTDGSAGGYFWVHDTGGMETNVRPWVQSRPDKNEGGKPILLGDTTADSALSSVDRERNQSLFKFGELGNTGRPFTFSVSHSLPKEPKIGKTNLQDIQEE